MKRFLMLSIMVSAVISLAAGQSPCAESTTPSAPSWPETAQNAQLSGKVIETMDSGSYTYVQLEAPGGKKTWLAIPKMKVTKGQQMSFKPGGVMKNFESKTLNRKFDEIIFSEGPVEEAEVRERNESVGSQANVVVTGEDIKVEKASGKDAYTVGEIYENIGTLDNKKVMVRGKVVKVSKNIMSKNWIHVQDGTGDARRGTRDLVVTTQQSPSVGDVVTVSGTLSKDKDFGSGYKYRVILENANVEK